MHENKIADIFIREGNKIEVSQRVLIDFLNSKGFGICRDKTHFLYERLLQNRENVVALFNPKELGHYLIELMKTSNVDDVCIEKFVKGISSYLSTANIHLLDTLDIDILKDEVDKAYFPFLNGLYVVSKNEISKIEYSSLSKPVLKDSLINRNYTITVNQGVGDFEVFCQLITGNCEERLKSFKSIYGYLLVNNKENKEDKAVIIYDDLMGNSKEANGGTGKSLLINSGLAQVRNVLPIDGKRFDERNTRFIYQNVEHSTNVILFDDVNERFSLNFIYSALTSSLEVEKKGVQARNIDYMDAPKFVITSNHPVAMKKGASSARRKIELILDNFFSEKVTPISYFRRAFFSKDWDDRQFNLFYTFIFECVQFYFQYGLVACPLTAEQKDNRLKGIISNEMYSFFEKELPSIVNKGYVGKREFVKSCQDNVGSISSHFFTKNIQIYCEHRELDYQEKNSGSITSFLIKKQDNE